MREAASRYVVRHSLVAGYAYVVDLHTGATIRRFSARHDDGLALAEQLCAEWNKGLCRA